MKLRILVDMDEVLCDLLTPWLAWYNARWNDTLKREALTTFDIHDFVKPECGHAIYSFFDEVSYETFEPVKGAIEGLTRLHADGHDIAVCTAIAGPSADTKISWLLSRLPWLQKKGIFTGHQKHWIKADVFIDDAMHNLKAYRAAWPKAFIVCMSAPYSRMSVAEILRNPVVDVYAEDTISKSAWRTICTQVEWYAKAPRYTRIEAAVILANMIRKLTAEFVGMKNTPENRMRIENAIHARTGVRMLVTGDGDYNLRVHTPALLDFSPLHPHEFDLVISREQSEFLVGVLEGRVHW